MGSEKAEKTGQRYGAPGDGMIEDGHRGSLRGFHAAVKESPLKHGVERADEARRQGYGGAFSGCQSCRGSSGELGQRRKLWRAGPTGVPTRHEWARAMAFISPPETRSWSADKYFYEFRNRRGRWTAVREP